MAACPNAVTGGWSRRAGSRPVSIAMCSSVSPASAKTRTVERPLGPSRSSIRTARMPLRIVSVCIPVQRGDAAACELRLDGVLGRRQRARVIAGLRHRAPAECASLRTPSYLHRTEQQRRPIAKCSYSTVPYFRRHETLLWSCTQPGQRRGQRIRARAVYACQAPRRAGQRSAAPSRPVALEPRRGRGRPRRHPQDRALLTS
jgi:hypothetical protein